MALSAIAGDTRLHGIAVQLVGNRLIEMEKNMWPAGEGTSPDPEKIDSIKYDLFVLVLWCKPLGKIH